MKNENIKEQQNYQHLIEIIPNGIIVVDEEGTIALANKTAEELFGYSREELLKIKIEDLVPQQYRAEHPGHRAQFYKVQQVRLMGAGRELFGLRKDNTLFPLEIGLNPLEIEGKRYVLALVVDITERKKIQEQFQQALEAAPNAMIMVDKTGKIRLVNKAMEELFGYSREELLTMNVDALVPRQYREKHPGHMAGFHKDSQRRLMGGQRDLYGLRKDGSEVPIEIGLNPAGTDKEKFVIASIVDITERKKAEVERTNLLNDLEKRVQERTKELSDQKEDLQRANKEAMAAVQAKSNFLANMSHEIRTPMNAILGFNELLSQTQLDNQQQEYIKTIKSSGDLLVSIINDILEFSKLDAGKLKLESVNFNLQLLISDVVKITTAQLEGKGIQIFIDFDPAVHPFLEGDPTRLRQVLVNLLGNAIKFTQKGKIGVIVTQDMDKSTDEVIAVRVIVRDTGIGVPQDKIEQIFKAFSQADNSTTRKFGGSGLGLTISKNLVELMGGKMWVESVEGKGSDFIFALKFKKGHPQADQNIIRQPAKEDDIKGVRILLVEDAKANQDLMKAYFEMIGCIGDYASNGLEAIDKIKNNSYDLCLMDIQMPVMGGIEATKIIREQVNKDIPIIALTANVMAEDRKKCMDAGMNDFLTKPINGTNLKEKIKEYSLKKG